MNTPLANGPQDDPEQAIRCGCAVLLAAGLLDKAVPVIPINSSEFPTPARRPHYSVLDKSSCYAALGGPAPHWRNNLRAMIASISAEQ